MSTFAVIGANYGDEGKGLVTDYLSCRDPGRTVVVRHNGGAQAGHTVIRNGERHVFKHHGSGTLVGAATYWSKFCPAHPMAFVNERAALVAAGRHLPKFYAHPDAPVTTYMDMVINQAIEHHRGMARHGSCGMGVNETIQRTIGFQMALRVYDLQDKTRAQLREILDTIRTGWVRRRCDGLGIPVPARIADTTLDDLWLDAAESMAASITVEPWPRVARRFAHHVFEGAQGLRLDEKAPGFPHVTRSRTGLTNVATLAAEADLSPVQPWYVTRWYLTRHGAGPIAQECTRERLSNRIADETNQPNQHQGTLRFAPLHVETMAQFIKDDYRTASNWWPLQAPRVVVTCLDQLPYMRTPPVPLADNRDVGVGDLALEIADATGATVAFAAGSEAINIEEDVRV